MATISSSETFAKRRAIFPSVHKTVNIQGYSKLREPIKTHENCYPLIWQILKSIYIQGSKLTKNSSRNFATGYKN